MDLHVEVLDGYARGCCCTPLVSLPHGLLARARTVPGGLRLVTYYPNATDLQAHLRGEDLRCTLRSCWPGAGCRVGVSAMPTGLGLGLSPDTPPGARSSCLSAFGCTRWLPSPPAPGGGLTGDPRACVLEVVLRTKRIGTPVPRVAKPSSVPTSQCDQRRARSQSKAQCGLYFVGYVTSTPGRISSREPFAYPPCRISMLHHKM
jgi:hypothetical protein